MAFRVTNARSLSVGPGREAPEGVVHAELNAKQTSSTAAATPPGPTGHPPLKGEGKPHPANRCR
ncbi:hypothetical protein D3Y55_23170 [Mesorhizobium sp. DCY119]|nr:hypothetical protein D3Y55_23170 [Mesorhizobium sp. DCY119]